MKTPIEQVVATFNTQPFLFVGSGMSKRYLQLPDWQTLLQTFANRINPDAFTFASYREKARSEGATDNLFARIAELIQRDFNTKWFDDPSFRAINKKHIEKIQEG